MIIFKVETKCKKKDVNKSKMYKTEVAKNKKQLIHTLLSNIVRKKDFFKISN